MNHLAKLLLAGCAVAGLTACEDLRGTLEVKQPLTIKTKKESKTLAQGNFEVGISLKNSTAMTVKVKVPNDKTVKMEVRVPRGIPTENGAFQSAAGENGQEFNIMGEVKTERYNSPISRNWRSCSFPIRERECHNEPVTECGVNAHGEKICKTRLVPVCRDVIRYIPGHEVYDGYTATKNEYMRANLLEPSTNALLGTLSTGDSDSHFVETWSSGCIMGPHYP